EQHTQVVELLDDGVAQRDLVGQPAPALERLLRLGVILPEVRRGDPRFDRLQFARRIGSVKDSSADPWRVWSGLRSGGRDLRSRATTEPPRRKGRTERHKAEGRRHKAEAEA